MVLTPGDPDHRAVPLTPLADDYGETLSNPLAGPGRTAGRSGMPRETVAAAVEAATERHGAALMAELGSRLPPTEPDDPDSGDRPDDPDSGDPDAEADASVPRTRGQPVRTRRSPLPRLSPLRTTRSTTSAVLAA
ncbi:hypothetical protein [Streptomyces sp. NPDC049879]|uniref:hypothetical protein n=1 Tax=Streptomyces sp. NPDC049879 TaxID=3365598 RepID=UPI0037A55566